MHTSPRATLNPGQPLLSSPGPDPHPCTPLPTSLSTNSPSPGTHFPSLHPAPHLWVPTSHPQVATSHPCIPSLGTKPPSPPLLPVPAPCSVAAAPARLGVQLHTKGLCAHPSPRRRPLPCRQTKALPVLRPGPAQAQGLARAARGNLPPSSHSAGWGPQAKGPQRHPLSRPASLRRQLGQRFTAGGWLTIRFVCSAKSGGKEGGKNQLLSFNI